MKKFFKQLINRIMNTKPPKDIFIPKRSNMSSETTAVIDFLNKAFNYGRWAWNGTEYVTVDGTKIALVEPICGFDDDMETDQSGLFHHQNMIWYFLETLKVTKYPMSEQGGGPYAFLRFETYENPGYGGWQSDNMALFNTITVEKNGLYSNGGNPEIKNVFFNYLINDSGQPLSIGVFYSGFKITLQ